MLTGECWTGTHATCSVPEWCECLCHISAEDLWEAIEAERSSVGEDPDEEGPS